LLKAKGSQLSKRRLIDSMDDMESDVDNNSNKEQVQKTDEVYLLI
jgi:hypothetical protein